VLSGGRCEADTDCVQTQSCKMGRCCSGFGTFDLCTGCHPTDGSCSECADGYFLRGWSDPVCGA
jgi:hypothetical protein